jgi:hypothetical protein
MSVTYVFGLPAGTDASASRYRCTVQPPEVGSTEVIILAQWLSDELCTASCDRTSLSSLSGSERPKACQKDDKTIQSYSCSLPDIGTHGTQRIYRGPFGTRRFKKIANFWRIFRVEFEPPDETGDFSKSPTSEQVTTDSVIIPFLAMGPVDRCQVARVGDDNYRQKVSVLQSP